MDSLPLLLLEQISEYLECADLRSLRLVNKLLAAISARDLFSELHFSADKQRPRYGYVGRSRSVRCTNLDKAVADVLPIARHVRKFYFTPAVVIAASKENSSTMDIEEVIWQRKMGAQDSNVYNVRELMNKLFDNMTRLRHVEIAAPMISKNTFRAFANDMDDTEVRSAVLASFVHQISHSIQHTQRHMEGLRISGLNGDGIKDTQAVRHMFCGLKTIELNILDASFLLERNNPSVLGELLWCAKSTLEHLSLTLGEHSHLPQRDVHSLANLLFSANLPIPFPRLESLNLVTIILSAQPLIDFLAAQLKLSVLTTHDVYLASSSIGWPEVVRNFPSGLKDWRLERLGHHPVAGFAPPISYNWTLPWSALDDDTVRSMGWERELEPNIMYLLCMKRKYRS